MKLVLIQPMSEARLGGNRRGKSLPCASCQDLGCDWHLGLGLESGRLTPTFVLGQNIRQQLTLPGALGLCVDIPEIL